MGFTHDRILFYSVGGKREGEARKEKGGRKFLLFSFPYVCTCMHARELRRGGEGEREVRERVERERG